MSRMSPCALRNPSARAAGATDATAAAPAATAAPRMTLLRETSDMGSTSGLAVRPAEPTSAIQGPSDIETNTDGKAQEPLARRHTVPTAARSCTFLAVVQRLTWGSDGYL